MKTLSSCFFILTLCISCDNETPSSTPLSSTAIMGRNTVNELPGNSANPYDAAGWITNELFESYYENPIKPTSISSIISSVETLAAANTNFKAIATASYHTVSSERIQTLLNLKDDSISNVISNSSLSTAAKTSLITFITSFLDQFATESNGEVLYNSVVAYENTIAKSPTFTSNDKSILYLTTSIIRHSSYLAKKKPKKNTDPDWTILILHIAASADGAEYGMAESITEGLAAGIASNQ